MNSSCVIRSACLTVLLLGLALQLQAQQSDDVVNGQKIFTTNCGACHGSDGRGGERAPDIATRREVVTRTDAGLIRAVQNGVSGTAMPAFGYMGTEKVNAVVRYLRTLQGIGVAVKAPGNPHNGEQLFYGKAECSKCHAVNGRGGFISSDLTGYGFGRSVENIRNAIIDPNNNLDRKSQSVTVITDNQQTYSGLIRNEDNFTIILQTQDGAFQSLSKGHITRVEYSGKSLMPGYEDTLTSKEIDDLVSFLLKTGSSVKNASNTHVSGDDDE